MAVAAREAVGDSQPAAQAAAHAQAGALAMGAAPVAGRGPATEQLATQTARHEKNLADLTTVRDQLEEIRLVTGQHRDAAGELSDAKNELAGLGRFGGRRKAELAQRITQIQAEQTIRLEDIAHVARAAAPLQHQLL